MDVVVRFISSNQSKKKFNRFLMTLGRCFSCKDMNYDDAGGVFQFGLVFASFSPLGWSLRKRLKLKIKLILNLTIIIIITS